MGETAADTQREIGQLRGDMDAALDEVERRVRGGVRGVASAETRVTSGRAREQLLRRVSEHQRILNAAIAGVGGAAAFSACAAVAALRERQKPQHRLQRRLHQLGTAVGMRAGDARQQAQYARERGLLLKLDKENGGYSRISDVRLGGMPAKTRDQSAMLKKLFWTGLVSVLVAVGSVVARRLASSVWEATVHEAPPESSSKAAA